MAMTWVALVLVLLRTNIRPVLAVMFEPLGKMALTNYIAATFIMMAGKALLGIPDLTPNATDTDFLFAAGFATAMLACQWLFSFLWLRHVGQGPLEKPGAGSPGRVSNTV